MKQIQYKTFSWNTHQKNWISRRPNVCQFELTFGCGLHCKHCYSDCYNKAEFIRNELSTKEAKSILDKVSRAGVIWLCLTGGDPLTRKDFLDIYAYAKKKGFIVSVFSNAYSMNKDIASHFRKSQPFVIEITLNAATEVLYDKITRVKGAFAKAMKGIDLILKSGIALKIKTQAMQDNLQDLPKIKKFVKNLGLNYNLSPDLYARLNGDIAPANLRIAVEDVFGLLDKKKELSTSCGADKESGQVGMQKMAQNIKLFRCRVESGDGFYVDPYGKAFICPLIRNARINLLKYGIAYAMEKSVSQLKNKSFSRSSKCYHCELIKSCRLCPGKAFLETKNMEGAVEYYCQLARLASIRN